MSCNTIKGGDRGASGFGVYANGTFPKQMAQIPMRGGVLLQRNNPSGWRGGLGVLIGRRNWRRGGKKNSVKTPKKMTAGTTLLDASVPALLLMSQQTYKRKGSQSRGRRNNRSRRTHKRR